MLLNLYGCVREARLRYCAIALFYPNKRQKYNAIVLTAPQRTLQGKVILISNMVRNSQ